MRVFFVRLLDSALLLVFRGYFRIPNDEIISQAFLRIVRFKI